MAGWLERGSIIFVCIIINIVMIKAQNQTAPCCKKSDDLYDAEFDFISNKVRLHPSISIVKEPTGTGCNTMMTIKITVSRDVYTQQRVLIDLLVDKPQGWVFNLGDSSSNNGWGGDAGTQSRDAELHLYNGILSGYFDDMHGSGKAFDLPFNPRHRITIIVGNEFSMCIADCDILTANYFQSPGWFALNGQTDLDGPVNHDLFLSTNSVVGPGGRVGSGVCGVGVKLINAY